MGMIKVTCQDCGREIQLNEYLVAGMVANGDLVHGFTRGQKKVNDVDSSGTLLGTTGEVDDYHEKLFDICKKCRALATPRAGDEEVLRERRIQHKVKLLFEMRPELSLEERVHVAVEEEFDPKLEPNKAFREYLIERQGL